MRLVELNENEYDYLTSSKDFLSKGLLTKIIDSSEKMPFKYILRLPEEDIDELRDLCGDQLQIVGFDKDYSLTLEGRILEVLIDKFF